MGVVSLYFNKVKLVLSDLLFVPSVHRNLLSFHAKIAMNFQYFLIIKLLLRKMTY